MSFKIWLEIEECDDEGDPINQDCDYSFILPFASSAVADTLQEALNLAVDMHNAVNVNHADYVIDTSEKEAT